MVRLSARIHPRTSKNTLRVIDVGEVEIWTTAPPADGKANDAVRRIVAEWLSVPISDVRVVSGAKSRLKTIDVTGVDTLPGVEPEPRG